MKPLLIEMVEVLLKKGEPIKMFVNSRQVNISGVSFWFPSSKDLDGYCFHCDFFNHYTDSVQEIEEYLAFDEVETMTLKKHDDIWVLSND